MRGKEKMHVLLPPCIESDAETVKTDSPSKPIHINGTVEPVGTDNKRYVIFLNFLCYDSFSI